MRYSKQREEILNVVENSCNHPDAKEVYLNVKKNIPNISLGTVYRNLNKLSDEKMILRIHTSDGNDRYDKTITNHNHIICEVCGKTCDIDFLLNEENKNNIEDKTGFKITNSNFNINGICNDCLKERK